ncbi:MAG: hypothetical protein J0I33_07515 [Microbacterium ginsengisoli]|jgi:hypothetical protein|uniref:hypothetical protein n=2 Tax=Microbacteriaceae TaxID=85023 RepID=UPI000B0803A8|nr:MULTISPECIES: hypothetical protein [unclassified Microbacterium]MBN9198471.1 hypothetical protein [Microbacterium ginsengisoli]
MPVFEMEATEPILDPTIAVSTRGQVLYVGGSIVAAIALSSIGILPYPVTIALGVAGITLRGLVGAANRRAVARSQTIPAPSRATTLALWFATVGPLAAALGFQISRDLAGQIFSEAIAIVLAVDAFLRAERGKSTLSRRLAVLEFGIFVALVVSALFAMATR